MDFPQAEQEDAICRINHWLCTIYSALLLEQLVVNKDLEVYTAQSLI